MIRLCPARIAFPMLVLAREAQQGAVWMMLRSRAAHCAMNVVRMLSSRLVAPGAASWNSSFTPCSSSWWSHIAAMSTP